MRTICQLVIALATLASASAVAMAAGTDGYDPPVVEPTTPWAAWAFAVLFIAGVAAVGFKNARRTHLD